MIFTRLLYAWHWLRAPLLGALPVTLYTRRGCPLCVEAARRLQAARRRWGFRLSSVPIDEDPTLLAAFGDCVPVVLVAGKLRFRGQVHPALLERLLRAEASAAARRTDHSPQTSPSTSSAT